MLKSWMVQCLSCKPTVTASRYMAPQCHHTFSAAAGLDASHMQLKPMFSLAELGLLGHLTESTRMTVSTYILICYPVHPYYSQLKFQHLQGVTLGGSTGPLRGRGKNIYNRIKIKQISPTTSGSSNLMSNIFAKFCPRWWDVAPCMTMQNKDGINIILLNKHIQCNSQIWF